MANLNFTMYTFQQGSCCAIKWLGLFRLKTKRTIQHKQNVLPSCRYPACLAQSSQGSFQVPQLWPDPKKVQNSIKMAVIIWYCEMAIDYRLTSPPVRIARSCRLDFLFSPKPGALIAQTCISCPVRWINLHMTSHKANRELKTDLEASTKLVKN